MSVITTTVVSILIFGAVIFIHELGHFTVAKLSNIQVNEFALGMGPTLFSFTKGETKYSLRALPIGGYVAMEGEDEQSDNPRAFNRAPIVNRIFVMIAGSIMNLVLGFFVLLTLVNMNTAITSKTVSSFRENAQTFKTGLRIDDEIIAVNGRKSYVSNDLLYEFARTEANKADFTVLRNGKSVELKDVTFDTKIYDDGYEQIVLDFTVYPVEKTFVNVIKEATNWSISLARLIFLSLIDLISGRVAINNLSGPVGIVTVISNAAKIGIQPILMILALITVNLGIFNLLPLPALDGGRLLLLIVEAIRGKAIPVKYEMAINATGFVLLMCLMIFTTFNDVTKLIG